MTLQQLDRPRVLATATTGGITWVCDKCHRPIANGQGYVHIACSAIRSTEAGQRKWDQEHPGPVYAAADLVTYPAPAPWEIHHHRCDPRPNSDDYWFGIERIRSAVDVIEWTEHLTGKAWSTDWSDTLRAVCSALRGAA